MRRCVLALLLALVTLPASAQSVASLVTPEGREVRFVAPLGIDTPPGATAAFRILVRVPWGVQEVLGEAGREFRMHVGSELAADVAAPVMPSGHPQSRLLVAMRLAVPPSMRHLRFQSGANRMQSPVIVAIADPRASIHYEWPPGADKRAAGCYNCDRPAHLIGKTEADGVYELFTNGRTIAVYPEPGDFAGTPYAFYGEKGRMQARVPTVMADTIRAPAVRVAANGPATAGGLLQERTYLHSGEVESSAADLDAGGRAGWNVVAARTYRSRTIGQSPLGAGWDAAMFSRLRSLPNGDVEYRDGAETWPFRRESDGRYSAPAGYFARLSRTDRGWTLLDQRGRITTFDDLGRLTAESDEFVDPNKPESGNSIRYLYGPDTRLSSIVDPVGRSSALTWDTTTGLLRELTDWRDRRVAYDYDAQRRLTVTRLPAVGGAAPFVRYAYTGAGGSLAEQLEVAPNLVSIHDPNEALGGGPPRVAFTYDDEDRVASQQWATGEGAALTYESPASVAVRDVLGQQRRYSLTAADTTNLLADRPHVVEMRELSVPVWSDAAFGALPASLEAGVPATTPADRVHTFGYENGVLTASSLAGIGETAIAYQASAGGAPGLRVRSSTTTPATAGGGGAASFLPAPAALTRSFAYQPGSNFLAGVSAGGLTIATAEPHRANLAPVEVNDDIRSERTFDLQGRLTGHASTGGTDPAGAGSKGRIDYHADSAAPHKRGLPSRIHEGDGDDALVTTIDYPTATQRKVTDARGVITTTDFDAWDRPVRVHVQRPGDPLVQERTSGYDASGRLVRTEERKGAGTVTTTYSYDVMGRLVSTTTNGIATVGSVTTTTSYDLASRRIITTLPGGAVTTTELDAPGRVARVFTDTGSSPVEQRFAYDLAGNRVFTTDMFTASAAAFDVHGRAIGSRAADGTIATGEYDPWGRPNAVKRLTEDAAVVAESALDFTAAGRLKSMATKIAGEATRTTAFGWDGGGRTTRAATNGRAEAATFDVAGRMTAYAAGGGDVTGVSEIFAREEIPSHSGRLPIVRRNTERSGATYTAEMERNALGAVTRESLGPLAWERAYDELGNVTMATTPQRPPTLWAVDARGAVEKQTLPDGSENALAYDANGAPSAYTDPVGEGTTTTRDRIGRPVMRNYPDGTTETIEWEGSRVKSVTDRQGRAQVFVYNAKGQLVEVVGGAEEVLERLAYDDAGRLVSWKNADAEIVWDAFDLAGNPGRTTQRRFTAGSGLAAPAEVLDEVTQEHRWNEHGERVRFSMPGADTPGGRWTRWVRQEYDAMGNVTSVARVNAESDFAGAALMTATYRGPGRPEVRTVMTDGPPIVRTYAYDAETSLLSRLEVTVSGRSIAGSAVAYDGLQKSEARLLGVSSAERSARFAYDPRSRLAASVHGTRSAAPPTTAVPGRGIEQLSRADFRNARQRLNVLPPATPGAAAVDPPSAAFDEHPGGGHKIAKLTRGPLVLPFGYDGAERVDDGRFVYVFDAKGRLIRATEKTAVPPTRRAIYSYGGTGRLVGRRVEYATSAEEWRIEDREEVLAADGLPAATTYAWDPISDTLLAVYRAGATSEPIQQIIHGGASYDDPLEITTASARLHPVYDEAGAGSLQAVVNGRGEVVARNLTNDPYGADDVALIGAAVDGVAIAATKNAAGELERVEITLHATEPLASATISAGARLAVVNAEGTALQIHEQPGALAADDPFSVRWTLDAASWNAFTAAGSDALSLSVAATSHLRAATWPADVPVMRAPDWALASKPVFTSPDLPFEVREPLASLTAFLDTIPAGASDTTVAYEVDLLPLLGVKPQGTALDSLLTARFHAQPLTDPLTRLNYVRNRWYDPGTGTFLSPDPMGYADSANLYAFAGGDPVNQRDPLGLCGEKGRKPCGFFGSAWESVKRTIGEQVDAAVDAVFYLTDFQTGEGQQRNAQATFDAGLRFAECGANAECALAQIDEPQREVERYLTASPAQRNEILGNAAGRLVVYGAEAYVTGRMSGLNGGQATVASNSAPFRARAANAYRNSILSSETGAVGPNITNQPGSVRTRMRDTRGRFVTDPASPRSPYTFTDAQRRAAWRRLAEDPSSPLTELQRRQIRERGWRGPQQLNPRTGELETMELSHEPAPLREGGTEVVPRWPEDHAAVDPYRHLKKQ